MIKKLLIAGCLVFACALIGCGDEDGDSSANSGGDTSSETSSETSTSCSSEYSCMNGECECANGDSCADEAACEEDCEVCE
ncbi:MAG: hypothetical protein HOI23_21385 [Deltaproteobacteria bacterium]|jgi:hypothetical protein|nr:hypothetical protein [Deltaproteobacteria bacterium]MBT6433596.1 hypothetical protein [Deltaproteobacteria bacterium]MBT6490829.1 hypothetical protein [Deltaproteobacteria bacterium]